MSHQLTPENVTAISDTREKAPLNLSPLRSVVGTLPTADYSLVGLENHVAVERKSCSDLLQCVGRERERFDREVQRLLAYPARLLIIEAPSLEYFHRGDYILNQRSRISPASVYGSLIGWMALGLPVVFAANHDEAGPIVARFLFLVARRQWRIAQAFCGGVTFEKETA